MHIIEDDNDALPALWGYHDNEDMIERDADGNLKPTPGTVWYLDGYTIIAPEGWN